MYIDANIFYGLAVSQPLPYDEIKFIGGASVSQRVREKNVELEVISNPPDPDTGYFVEVDLKNPDEMKEKAKNFRLSFENKISPEDKFFFHIRRETKHILFHKIWKSMILKCDCGDKKKNLIHYRMLKSYARLGIKVQKVHEVISFRQCNWLERNINFNTQKRKKAENDFQRDFYILLKNAFFGKMEIVCNRIKVKITKKDDNDIFNKQQSNFTFNGIQKSYTIYDSYPFKQIEVLLV